MEIKGPIGIIAGNGIYPEMFIKAARAKEPDASLVVAAFRQETQEQVAAQGDVLEWFRVGQLGKMIKYFTKNGCQRAVMMGQIAPKNLYDLRPDLRTVAVLARLKEKNAETLFGAIAEELQKDGITLLPAITHLEDSLPGEGHVFGPKLKKGELLDAEFGFKIAKESSRLDIGQSVVVRDGTVLAVEAFEGTNACIRRGGKLGKGKNVKLVKVSKPHQDFRFDVPCIGPDTIKNCAESQISTVIIEANKTLLLDQVQIGEMCQEQGVSLYAISD